MAVNNEEGEERLAESNSSVIRTTTISELPGKSFGITVEIPIFLTMVGLAFTGAPITNILMYRTCFHVKHYSDSECKVFLSPDRTNVTKHIEEEVQIYTTFINVVRDILESFVPAVLSFFLGVWSDTYGRKPLIVWPLLGIALSRMLIVVFSLLNNVGPWWYILTSVPSSLSGGYIVLFTGILCYLNDITTLRNKSLRMTILETSIAVGIMVGSFTTFYLIRAVGNVYVILISASLAVTAYAFAVLHLRESLTGALDSGITTVLDLLLVKEMFRECFKRRPNNGRAQILLLCFANVLPIFILYGIIGLEYMYARTKIHWALKQYTVYSAANTSISFFGSLVGVALIQRLFGISDLTFVLIAFLSSIAEYLTKAFATLGWHMYLSASISLFKGLTSPLIRSFLTKILPVEDIAKVFAFMSAVEGLCPLISSAVYNTLYAGTIGVFPGAIYLLSAGFSGASFVMVCFVQYYIWKGSRTPTYTTLVET